MLGSLRGLFVTISASPGLAVREMLRRLLGRPYRYRGVVIQGGADFRALRNALRKGIRVWGDGENAYFETEFGVLAVPLPRLVYSVLDDIEYYSVLGVEGRTVLDIGAYIGDTALFFASKGARKVYAYEPVFYEVAKKNVELNKANDIIEIIPKGIYYKEKKV